MARLNPIMHPVFTGWVALLALNDHVLKTAWPGAITGKLSDFAGVFIVGVVTAVVLGNRFLGLTATAIAFTTLKTLPVAAELAAPVLGGVTRMDATDLVALTVLPAAFAYLGRFPNSVRGESETKTEGLRQALIVTVGVATILTVTATSCEDALSVDGFASHPEGIVATGTVGQHLSLDGGITWTVQDANGGAQIAAKEACLNDGRCFRVVDNSRVDEQIGGQWVTAFEFSDKDTERMNLRTDYCSGRGDTSELFDSLAVAKFDNTQAIVVSMKTQGVLRLDPATQEWTRHKVIPGVSPLDTYGPVWFAWLQLSPAALVILSPALLFIGRRPSRWTPRIITTILVALGAALLTGFALFVMSTGSPDYFDFGVGLTIICVVVFVLSALFLFFIPPKTPEVAPPPPKSARPPGGSF